MNEWVSTLFRNDGKIKVTGYVKEEYRSIHVDTLEVSEGKRFVNAWSSQINKRNWNEWRRRFYEAGSEN